ncbi:hypothetical protein CLV32_2184 [Pedobacter duraquae]|uniref:Uncharacterized protein n=1 Tax=Pedobacter duraquae TaxID=425511 RepID=A0A4R6IM55_9SPHI|nr:hypothetical protein CLV32_2184 [Pedobacter duraquae]
MYKLSNLSNRDQNEMMQECDCEFLSELELLFREINQHRLPGYTAQTLPEH